MGAYRRDLAQHVGPMDRRTPLVVEACVGSSCGPGFVDYADRAVVRSATGVWLDSGYHLCALAALPGTGERRLDAGLALLPADTARLYVADRIWSELPHVQGS